mgnify:CR=1 FL=1
MKDKLFIVRKYIKARSAREAIKKDKIHPVDDVWVDDDWKKENYKELNNLENCIGFKKN